MSHSWALLIFADIEKTRLLTATTHKTIREIAYILGMKSDEVSNCFHRLIRPRKMLLYCDLRKVKRVQQHLKITWYISKTATQPTIIKHAHARSNDKENDLGFGNKAGGTGATRRPIPLPAFSGGVLWAEI